MWRRFLASNRKSSSLLHHHHRSLIFSIFTSSPKTFHFFPTTTTFFLATAKNFSTKGFSKKMRKDAPSSNEDQKENGKEIIVEGEEANTQQHPLVILQAVMADSNEARKLHRQLMTALADGDVQQSGMVATQLAKVIQQQTAASVCPSELPNTLSSSSAKILTAMATEEIQEDKKLTTAAKKEEEEELPTLDTTLALNKTVEYVLGLRSSGGEEGSGFAGERMMSPTSRQNLHLSGEQEAEIMEGRPQRQHEVIMVDTAFELPVEPASSMYFYLLDEGGEFEGKNGGTRSRRKEGEGFHVHDDDDQVVWLALQEKFSSSPSSSAVFNSQEDEDACFHQVLKNFLSVDEEAWNRQKQKIAECILKVANTTSGRRTNVTPQNNKNENEKTNMEEERERSKHGEEGQEMLNPNRDLDDSKRATVHASTGGHLDLQEEMVNEEEQLLTMMAAAAAATTTTKQQQEPGGKVEVEEGGGGGIPKSGQALKSYCNVVIRYEPPTLPTLAEMKTNSLSFDVGMRIVKELRVLKGKYAPPEEKTTMKNKIAEKGDREQEEGTVHWNPTTAFTAAYEALFFHCRDLVLLHNNEKKKKEVNGEDDTNKRRESSVLLSPRYSMGLKNNLSDWFDHYHQCIDDSSKKTKLDDNLVDEHMTLDDQKLSSEEKNRRRTRKKSGSEIFMGKVLQEIYKCPELCEHAVLPLPCTMRFRLQSAKIKRWVEEG